MIIDLNRVPLDHPTLVEQCETVQPVQPVEQPANLLLEDEDRPMIYQCRFCGAPLPRPSE